MRAYFKPSIGGGAVKIQNSLEKLTYGLLEDIYYNNVNNCRSDLVEETKNMVIRYLDLSNYRELDQGVGNNTLRQYSGFREEDIRDMLGLHFNELKEVLSFKLSNIPRYKDFIFRNSGFRFRKEIYPSFLKFLELEVIEDLSRTMEEESIIIKNMIFRFEKEKSKV